MCDGQACNEPSGRGVVTARYCDWSDGQIKASNKTLLAPHTVTMYRLWDARWHTHFTHFVGVEKQEARQTL